MLIGSGGVMVASFPGSGSHGLNCHSSTRMNFGSGSIAPKVHRRKRTADPLNTMTPQRYFSGDVFVCLIFSGGFIIYGKKRRTIPN
jgi:hypothetical protein